MAFRSQSLMTNLCLLWSILFLSAFSFIDHEFPRRQHHKIRLQHLFFIVSHPKIFQNTTTCRPLDNHLATTFNQSPLTFFTQVVVSVLDYSVGMLWYDTKSAMYYKKTTFWIQQRTTLPFAIGESGTQVHTRSVAFASNDFRYNKWKKTPKKHFYE